MPSYVITNGPIRTGRMLDAVNCDLDVFGFPDRRTSVPVKIKLVNERVLSVDDELRGIISAEGQNGVMTYLVDGSTARVRNRERRIALERASVLLKQLRDCILPLKAQSGEPELATEGLGLLFVWIGHERLTTSSRSADTARG